MLLLLGKIFGLWWSQEFAVELLQPCRVLASQMKRTDIERPIGDSVLRIQATLLFANYNNMKALWVDDKIRFSSL
jgi:hypothetical protein